MGILTLIFVGLLVVYVLFNLAGGLINLIIPLLIWALIGWLAGKLMRGRGYGALNNILIGLGGGMIGGILFSLLRIRVGGLLGGILAGIVGAMILIYIGRQLRRS